MRKPAPQPRCKPISAPRWRARRGSLGRAQFPCAPPCCPQGRTHPRVHRRSSAQRVHSGVQNARPQGEAALHPRHHGPVPARVDPAGARRQPGQRQVLHRGGRQGPEPPQPGQRLLRWCAAPAERLRAGHHALHHRLHHHPAPAGRHPPLRGAPQGGAGGHRQAHRVHPLPHHRPGTAAVQHHRGHGQERSALPGVRQGPAHHRRRLDRHPAAHHHHHDRRHRPHHVAG